MKKTDTKEAIRRLAYFSVFTALVILLQSIGAFIKIGATSVSLVLIPIVLGGMLLGRACGTWLGFLFGLMTLIAGISGTDAFTSLLFSTNPVGTIILCLGKAMLAGFGAAALYRIIKPQSEAIAIFVAAAAAPILNTGFFVLYCLAFMRGSITAYMSANGITDGTTVLYFLIILCAGLNFIAELAVNITVSPALKTVVNLFDKHQHTVG